MSVTKTVLMVWFSLFVSSLGLATESSVSKDQAQKTALSVYPGKVKEVEEEKHKGEPVFSIEIDGKDGVHEIVIRKSDGKIIENKTDKEDEDED